MYASGYVFGDLQLFIPIDTFRSIYGAGAGVSWLFVRVDSVANVPGVTAWLKAAVGDVADIRAARVAMLKRPAPFSITHEGTTMKSLNLKVEGLRCDGCAEKVQNRLAAQSGVKDTQVSFEQGQARVLYDPQTTNEAHIVQVIEGLGYRVADHSAG